jgi:hypothetical protein
MREFLSQPPPRRAAIRDLMKALLDDDPFERRCAADLARLVSASEPGILQKYAGVLIDLVAAIPLEQWQARGYVTLAAALSAATRPQRMRLVVQVRRLAEDRRIALRAIALEAFAILASAEPELRDEAMERIEKSRRDNVPAMRTRARRMMLLLMAPNEKKSRATTQRL